MATFQENLEAYGELGAIQLAVKELVSGFEGLDGVTILHEQAKDLAYEIQKAIAEIGIVATVLTVDGTDESPGVPELIFDDCYVVIEVKEDPLVNRGASGTQIPGGRAADIIARGIKRGLVGVDGEPPVSVIDGNRTLTLKRLRMVPGGKGQEHLLIWHVICQL